MQEQLEQMADDVYSAYLGLVFVVAGVFLLAYIATKRQMQQKLTIQLSTTSPQLAEGESDDE